LEVNSLLNWRLIDTDQDDPYFVTAADEALALSISKGNSPDTLHFYRRNPPGVSVGYFRKVEEDVFVNKCDELGVKIVRRTSAGGTIYTDKNQLIYSIITRQPLGDNMEDTFVRVCKGIIDALSALNISSSFKPPNDILINGKKISGSAQVKKKNVYLIHGTIIFDLSHKTIESILKHHKPGYASSILEECGFIPDLSALKFQIKKSFEKKFNSIFQPATFSKEEGLLIQNLIEKKYGTREWNFKR
jgi:lipoate-protein ligase A